MDLLRVFLETAFSSYPLSEIIENRLSLEENTFVDYVRQKYYDLSDDHIRQIFKLYQDEWCKGLAEDNVFHSLNVFTKEVLCMGKGVPMVRLEHLFRWRELTQSLGEDLLTCSFLAYKDVYQEECRRFDWPSVLRTDDINLDFLSHKGFAELHHHLKASTDVFGISWLCLMNHTSKRHSEFVSVCASAEEAEELYQCYILAVAIRWVLFRYLEVGKIDHDEALKFIRDSKFHARFGDVSELNAKICRRCTDQHAILDYASCHLDTDCRDSVFASERWLQYAVLKRIYEGEDDALVTELMMKYVLIKSKIRDRFVQNNENVGFGNFNDYERRKEIFLERYPHYAQLLFRLPIAEAGRHHHVKYIETRVTPKMSLRNLHKSYQDMTGHIEDKLRKENLHSDIKYGIIYHFIKKKEKINDSLSWMVPRNHQVRNEVKHQAIAIKGLIERNGNSRKKIVGIDAANSEFYCRPEVFAQAFRYLKNTGLKRTFHVGEDFYDLADGLRAIDEAITFLDLERGDRLGHCLALGLAPDTYYHRRHGIVPIPKQNLLDNLVWLYFKAKSYNISMAPNIEMEILDKFTELSKMYCDDERDTINMIDYYHMMKVRGDAPMGQEDVGYGIILGNWDAYDMDPHKDVKIYRKEKNVADLYHAYHFSKKVKEQGEEVVEFKVNCEYDNLIYLIQERMMDDIESKGIAIECCPSSNFRIGRLIKYEHHPIFRMFDVDPDGKHHLPVTVNTDDLGIFTTSLENEYSLLMLALLKMKDADGKRKYNSLYIQTWMEQVVRHGWKYCFNSNM